MLVYLSSSIVPKISSSKAYFPTFMNKIYGVDFVTLLNADTHAWCFVIFFPVSAPMRLFKANELRNNRA